MGLASQPLHTEAGPQSLTRLQKEAGGLPWDQIRGGLRLGDSVRLGVEAAGF